MGLTLTASAYCDMCGEPLSSSDEDCEACKHSDNVLMIFRKGTETETISLALLASENFMWEKFARSIDDDPLGWMWLGDNTYVEDMLDSPSFDDITDIPYRSTTLSYDGDEDLRELSGYEEG